MITPTYDDLHPPFGPLLAQKFSVMLDECDGIAESVRRCPARSTLAGDTMNRWYAVGAVIRGNRELEVEV